MHIELNKDTENVIGAVRSGYGGVFQDGVVADRRWHPFIQPLAENPELGIPAPKDVTAFEFKEGSVKAIKLLKTETTNYVVVPVLMLQALLHHSIEPAIELVKRFEGFSDREPLEPIEVNGISIPGTCPVHGIMQQGVYAGAKDGFRYACPECER